MAGKLQSDQINSNVLVKKVLLKLSAIILVWKWGLVADNMASTAFYVPDAYCTHVFHVGESYPFPSVPRNLSMVLNSAK